jgi:hypothetical protein
MSTTTGMCTTPTNCDSDEYCAQVTNGSGRCRPCAECVLFADAYQGQACPAACLGSTNSSETGAASADEFFDAFSYWQRVRDEGFDADEVDALAGCVDAANEATMTTTGSKKGQGGCAPVFTRKAEGKWCDMGELTLRYPYNSCAATASNDYCGVKSPEICIAGKYFECCPTRPGAIVGVSVTVGLAAIALQYYIYKRCYTRKLIKRVGTWKHADIEAAAQRAVERNPRMSMRIHRNKVVAPATQATPASAPAALAPSPPLAPAAWSRALERSQSNVRGGN